MNFSKNLNFCHFFASPFITKAEFDSLKNNFQSQIDQYNSSIDSKIDGAIAAYLAGIKLSTTEQAYKPISPLGYPLTLTFNDAWFDSSKYVNDPDSEYFDLWKPSMKIMTIWSRLIKDGDSYTPIVASHIYDWDADVDLTTFYDGQILNDNGTYKFLLKRTLKNYNNKINGSTIVCVISISAGYDYISYCYVMYSKKGSITKQQWKGTQVYYYERGDNEYYKNFELAEDTLTDTAMTGMNATYWGSTGKAQNLGKLVLYDANSRLNSGVKWSSPPPAGNVAGYWEYGNSGNMDNMMVKNTTFEEDKVYKIWNSNEVKLDNNKRNRYLNVSYTSGDESGKVYYTNIRGRQENIMPNWEVSSQQQNAVDYKAKTVRVGGIISPGYALSCEDITTEKNGTTTRPWYEKSLIKTSHICYNVTFNDDDQGIYQTVSDGLVLCKVQKDNVEDGYFTINIESEDTTEKKYIIMSKSPIAQDDKNNINNANLIKIGKSKSEVSTTATPNYVIELKEGENKIYFGECKKGDLIYYKILWDKDNFTTVKIKEAPTATLTINQ